MNSFLIKQLKSVIDHKFLYVWLLLSGLTFATVHAQEFKKSNITISVKNEPVATTFKKITQLSNYNFFYDEGIIEGVPAVNLDYSGAELQLILNDLTRQTGLNFILSDNTITVSRGRGNAVPEKDQIRIGGVIKDQAGEPLIGVSIVEKDQPNDTITDAAGNFTITVKPGATLRISYIGYVQREIRVTEEKNINVVLQEDNKILDEIVVVGYGTQKRVTLTGAVAAITDEELTLTKTQNAQNMLIGKVPGVRVVQKTSEPGQFSNNFDIRGYGAPLVVVDGVPRESFTRMDPNEIESISVLKDASAAVYGVKAANGVVLITTKKGKKGKPTLSYDFYYGLQMPSGLPKSLNVADWMTLSNEKAMHNVNGGTKPYSEELINEYRSGARKSTDWNKEVLQKTAPQQSHNLSITGGADNYDYYINAGYMYHEGFWKTGDLNYKRYNVRSNVNMKITDHLKASLNLSGIYDDTNQPSTTDTYQVFKFLWALSSNVPYYANETAPYYNKTQDGLHPGIITNRELSGYKRNENRIFQGDISLTYDFPWIKGLTAKGLYSYDYYMTSDKSFRKAYNIYEYNESTDQYLSSTMNSPSQVRRSFLEKPNTLLQVSLSYDKIFGKKHSVGALMLYEETVKKADNFYA
ncbi:MAG: SusC/RagA family TonB-linked outer membrane protein [Bacteroides sp.]|nr:SusC/RagA family TonB-linked outer membrane protein [Bacteroides sp.]